MADHESSDEVRARLHELRRSTDRRVAELVNGFDAIVEASRDVAVDDEHDPEGHTIAWERQQLAALLTEARATLTAIDAAEQRLEQGRYGVCTVCEGAVSIERLSALPDTPLCIDCVSNA